MPTISAGGGSEERNRCFRSGPSGRRTVLANPALNLSELLERVLVHPTLLLADAILSHQCVLKVRIPRAFAGAVFACLDRGWSLRDLIFAGSVGRTDLPGGDPAALVRSIKELMQLPDETKLLPGHGPSTTVGRERLTNPFLKETDEDGWLWHPD